MPRLTIEQQNDLEAMLAAWGPLCLNSQALLSNADTFDVDEHSVGAVCRMLHGVDVELTNVHVTAEQINGPDDQFSRVDARYIVVTAANGRALGRGQKTAIIPIVGPVTPFGVPKIYEIFGIRVAALPNIVAAARAAANDPEVGRIVLAVHSPGGSAFGVQEAAAALREVAKRKPLVAAVSYLAASAGYWLASAAREIIAEPSALIGSIGARISHVDQSKRLEMLGITVTDLSVPDSKSDVSDVKPLSETGRAELMRIVQTAYDAFAADISSARRIDMVNNREQYGRVHPSPHARTIGLVDRVATFETLIGEVVGDGDMTATRRARLAIMEYQSNA